METILNYYNTYDEDNRLVKDKAHEIEFITTVHFLDKLINKTSKVLDVGAGTGRYSFYFAEKGCEVTALDITPRHVDIMKEKAAGKTLKLNPLLGNALDMKEIEDNSFDAVLCLGPLYHLTNEEQRKQCIKESLRVLKPGGVLAIAYINRVATFVNYIHRNVHNINNAGLWNITKTGLEFNSEEDCFYYSTYAEMEALMNSFNVYKIDNIASDGVGGTLRDIINKFTDEEFNKWMEFHLMTCNDPSLMGYSQHGLYLCRKA